MTNEIPDVNCIGYAAWRMGYDETERFIHCPELSRVLALHDKVEDIKSAKLVGVVSQKELTTITDQL